MESNSQAKFHTLQLFVWRSSEHDLIEDIAETGVEHVRVLKDIASENITQGTGKSVELRAFDRNPASHEAEEVGKWDVVWELPPRCRRERPCVVVDGVPVDLVRFVKERS